MKTILYKIPFALLYSRLLVAVLLIVFSFTNTSSLVIIGLCVYAIISDVLDGMIARRLKISTVEMRQMDTKIDTVFWFSCLFYLSVNQHAFIKSHILELFMLVFSELFIILFGLVKFRERISFHTLLSKFWALVLLWFFIDLLLGNTAYISFKIAFWYGLLVQAEILAIALILKSNQPDIPGILQAINCRKGLPVKRNRFFNG
ncbi:MAG: CDP-alcohol phosphatidyltransferase family protein [Bacteroidota bacterium]